MMHWVMDLRSEPLTILFKGFTSLGGIAFLGLAMSSGYWLWRKKLFAELILLYCLSGMLNNHLKETWREPRPFQNPEADVTSLIHVSDGSWSFPSGHAQTAALLWGWLAVSLKIRWVYVASGIMIVLVAASRVYLGVHYPIDVIVGMGLGLAGLGLFRGAKALHARFLPSLPGRAQIVFLLVAIVLWFVLFPGEKVPRYVFGYGGGLLGFWGGVVWDRSRWRFVPQSDPRSAVGMLTVGLGVPGLLFLVFREPFAAWRREVTTLDLHAFAYLALTILGGAWISAGAPRIFLRARERRAKKKI